MFDDYTKFILSCLVLFSFIALFQFFAPREAPQPGAKNAANTQANENWWKAESQSASSANELCFHVVTGCRASAEVQMNSCDRTYASGVLGDILSKPLEIGECATLMRDIELECPSGCRADFTSLMSLPGDTKIADDEFSQGQPCLVKGSRKVSISMNCVRRKKS